MHKLCAQGDSDVISPFDIFAICFAAMMWGEHRYSDIAFSKLVIMPAYCCVFNCVIRNTVTFRKKDGNKMFPLHTVRHVAAQHGDRVMTIDYRDFIAPYE